MTNVEENLTQIGMEDQNENLIPLKRPRTRDDFYLFCKIILDYENYEMQRSEDLREQNSSPPLDSSGSSVNSESTISRDDKPSGDETDTELNSPDELGDPDPAEDADSYDSVTCYCSKPFAGRPMIECSICLTWVHLSCAKIRKNNIPDVFYCALCKGKAPKRGVGRPRASAPNGLPPIKRFKRGNSIG